VKVFLALLRRVDSLTPTTFISCDHYEEFKVSSLFLLLNLNQANSETFYVYSFLLFAKMLNLIRN